MKAFFRRPPPTISLIAVSHADSYRPDTEDRTAILPRENGGLLLVVSDGVGGRLGGGPAAEFAITQAGDLHPDIRAGDADGWTALLTHLDTKLSSAADAGETTLVLAEVTARGIFGASVGDSEAWRIPDDPNAGPEILTANQKAKPFLGSGMSHPVSFRARPLAPGDTLLVATDGLFKYADNDAILSAAHLPDLDTAARKLVQTARGSSSGRLYDDIVVLLCRRAG